MKREKSLEEGAGDIAREQIRQEMRSGRPTTKRKVKDVTIERRNGVRPQKHVLNPITGDSTPMTVKQQVAFIEQFPQVRDPYLHSEMTPEVRQAIIDCVRDGNYVYVAACKVGVDEAVINAWMKRAEQMPGTIYETFAKELKNAMAEAEIGMVKRVRSAAEKDHLWTAAAWWLERSQPDRWAQKAIVKHQVERELHDFLRHLQRNLPKDVFKQVIEVGLKGNVNVEAEEEETTLEILPNQLIE